LLSLFVSALAQGGSSSIICFGGCPRDKGVAQCNANFTCSIDCSTGYDNDHVCDHCALYDSENVYSLDTKPPINGKSICVHISPDRILNKSYNSYLPDEKHIRQMEISNIDYDAPAVFEFNDETFFDSGPCPNLISKQNPYKRGHWFRFDTKGYTGAYDYLILSFNASKVVTKNIYIDITSSNPNQVDSKCLTNNIIKNQTDFVQMDLPVADVGADKTFYGFMYQDGYEEVNITAKVFYQLRGGVDYEVVIDNDFIDSYMDGQPYVHTFDISRKGYFGCPICLPGLFGKNVVFNTNFVGNFSVAVTTTSSNRLVYMQEYGVLSDGNFGCFQLWKGERQGVLSSAGENAGVHVRIKGEKDTASLRYFSFVSFEMNADVTATFTRICEDNCHEDDDDEIGPKGYCSTKQLGCVCTVEDYGGERCEKMCYNNKTKRWVNITKGQYPTRYCRYGEKGCTFDCKCEEGYVTIDHLCVSQTCRNTDFNDPEVECAAGSEGCLANCKCDTSVGFTYDKEQHLCIPNKCGNGRMNDLVVIGKDSNDNDITREKECDGGLNCLDNCMCREGYKQDRNDRKSCTEKHISNTLIALIIVAAIIAFIIVLIILGVLLFFILRVKRIDLDIYRQQQPFYYLYLSGSVGKEPSIENKYTMDPLELDFGNENTLTAIFDTRFEKIEVKNKSKNKWIMVIFHTPNNPKFVFHFEPQVLYLRPRGFTTMTVFMTLHCTTHIKDMKIPYTVWFSKHKGVLSDIADLLKGKTFDDFTEEDKEKMNKLCKSVVKHYHHNLTIKTEAATSTHLDMDELNMREQPIAEGAMGRVYIGEYRTVPVAIKQFRWENLTHEEMEELKEDVMNECEIMDKLRNPFIANYIGSVTYVPQISMVIQFFALGSLGEYVRQDSEEYIKLPYNLKLRLMYDTARGMAFLHENRILHLDLKPDNLLINSLFADSACCVKITDFGTSRFTKKGSKSEDKGLGTPIYVAPEAYKDIYTEAGDVYSYAVTCWEIFYQEEPYKDFKSLFEIKDYVVSGKRLKLDDTIPTLLKNMIEACWKNEPDERITFEEVCKRFIAIVDDQEQHMELDADVDIEKIKRFVDEREERIQNMLTEFYDVLN